MNRSEAEAYAREWADAWNRLDVDAVLEHFADAVEFSSPIAQVVVGTPTVHGKQALGEYWRAALKPVESMHFTVVRVIWDAATSELAIIYDRVVNGQGARVAEVLQFGPDGRVVRGEVFQGVTPVARERAA